MTVSDSLSIKIHVVCGRFSSKCESAAVVFAPLTSVHIPDSGDRFVVDPYSVPDPEGWGRSAILRELLCPSCFEEEKARQKLNTAVKRRGR